MPTTKKRGSSPIKKSAPKNTSGAPSKAVAPKSDSGAEKIIQDIAKVQSAVRDVGVAGSKSSVFPARYSLIPAHGLLAIAQYARDEGREFIEQCLRDEKESYHGIMEGLFRFIELDKEYYILKAGLGFVLELNRYEPPSVNKALPVSLEQPEFSGYDFTAISATALRRLAETCGEGEAKYGMNNWLKGFKLTELLDHAIAHANSYFQGDTTEDHLAHGLWNVLVFLHFYRKAPASSELRDFSGQR